VSAAGGVPQPLSSLDATRRESAHAWPMFVAGSRRFLFLSRTTASESSRIELASLDDPQRRIVTNADALVGYVKPWLVFAIKGVIYAQRFDPDTATLQGNAVVIRRRRLSRDVVNSRRERGRRCACLVPVSRSSRSRAVVRTNWSSRRSRVRGR
jgi:hypothetical protein